MIQSTGMMRVARHVVGVTDGKPTMAARNTATIRELVKFSRGKHLILEVEGDWFLDLADGPLVFDVGAARELIGLTIFGPGRIIGINAQRPTIPVLRINRAPGTLPMIHLSDLIIRSNGSGIGITNGGSQTILERITIEETTGQGILTLDGWSDVEVGSCGYGLLVEDSDGLFVRDLLVRDCAGHGVVCTRWHAGELSGYCRGCGGSGAKLQQANGLRLSPMYRAEMCRGYGLHVRDTGIDRFVNGRRLGNQGGPNEWHVWLEANNGRGDSAGHGYRYSQARFDNTSRIAVIGHSGWRAGQVRVDPISRHGNVWIERNQEIGTVPTRTLLDATVPLEAGNPPALSNWDEIWPDPKYRPQVELDGPDSVKIRWPVGSFDNVAKQEVAYWRPWGLKPLSSPGTFAWRADVLDLTGAVAAYCKAREDASPRLCPCAMVMEISPVAGDIVGVSLWDTDAITASGEITVNDARDDIGLSINAWVPGMESRHCPQIAEHVVAIDFLEMWKL